MKKSFLLLSLIFFHYSKAQVIIGGLVSGPKGNLPGASLSFLEKSNQRIFTFTITKNDGTYSVVIHSENDSIDAEISSIGYSTVRKRLSNRSQQINFFLPAAKIELPEINIDNKPPVFKRGDTLNYDVAAFSAPSDRVIGDVIKKMPGIEVEPNGQVKYQGKPIRNYYIENLDILESKYNIANQNIPADMVETVQVLENHQPIRILDSTVFSDRAALNIKLKPGAKNRWVATGKIGFGITPFLWDNEMLALNFRKGFQFISGYKNNNTGKDLSAETTDLYYDPYDKQSFLSEKQDILHLVNPGAPPFSEKRYRFNKTHLLYSNGLFVISKSSQLRYSISYVNENDEQNTQLNTQVILPGGNVTIAESQVGLLYKNHLLTDVNYTANSKKIYFKNNIKVENFGDKGMSEVMVDSYRSSQNLKNPMFQVVNNCHAVFQGKKNRYEFISNLIIKQLPQQLVVLPGLFNDFFNASIEYNNLGQQVTKKVFSTDNSVLLRKNLLGFNQAFAIGFGYQDNSLVSSLDKDSSHTIIVLPDSFQNNLQWRQFKPYSEIELSFGKGGFAGFVKSSLSYSVLQRNDKVLQGNFCNRFLFFNNSFTLRKGISRLVSLSWIFSNESRLWSIDQAIPGYMLADYRNILRNDLSLSRSKTFRNAVQFNYRNPVKTVFGYISLSYNITSKNLLYDYVYYGKLAVQKSIDQSNKQPYWVTTFNLSKFFKKTKTGISVTGFFSKGSYLQIQNGTTVKLFDKTMSSTINIYCRKIDWFYPEFNSVLNITTNSILTGKQRTVLAPLYQLNQGLKLGLFIDKNIILTPSVSHYFNSFKGNNSYIFLDIAASYKKPAYEFELALTNIGGLKEFTMFNNADNIQTVQTYRLRPLNMTLQLKFRL